MTGGLFLQVPAAQNNHITYQEEQQHRLQIDGQLIDYICIPKDSKVVYETNDRWNPHVM